MSSASAPIFDVVPVTVITGFLGAGKTTLLARLLRHPGLKDTAVIINEFGEVGLDHLLVEKSGETLVELNSGCLCCTVRGDLIDTLNMLFLKRVKGEVPYFKRVVIETTGLADPAPVLHSLLNDPMVIAHYELDGVITVVDALNGGDTLDRHQEAVKQAAVADRIVLSKTDLLPPGDGRAKIEGRLRALNPAARFLTPDEALADPMAFLSGGFYDLGERPEEVREWLRIEAYGEAGHGHAHDDHGHDHAHSHDHGHAHAAPDVNRHDDHIQAFCILRDAPISGTAFSLFVELLIANRGADLLRVKGILNIAEKPGTPAVIHGVQHVFHPVMWLDEWPDDDRRSKLVFIVRDIPRAQIESLLGALDGSGGMTDAEIGATMAKGESLLRNGLKA